MCTMPFHSKYVSFLAGSFKAVDSILIQRWKCRLVPVVWKAPHCILAPLDKDKKEMDYS